MLRAKIGCALTRHRHSLVHCASCIVLVHAREARRFLFFHALVSDFTSLAQGWLKHRRRIQGGRHETFERKMGAGNIRHHFVNRGDDSASVAGGKAISIRRMPAPHRCGRHQTHCHLRRTGTQSGCENGRAIVTTRHAVFPAEQWWTFPAHERATRFSRRPSRLAGVRPG